MATPSDQPVNDLTSRLRAAAQPPPAPPAQPYQPAWEPTPPASVPPAPPQPVYRPMPGSGGGGGGGGTKVGIIVAAVVGGLVVVPILAIVAITLLGRTAETTFEEVSPSTEVDTPASTVFQPISGYTYRPVPQSDLDQVRSGIEAETPAGYLETVDGRIVRKDGKNVAEAIVTIFNADDPFDAEAAMDGVAETLASHEDITIGGARALYGKASNGAEIVAVYKNHKGIAVAGSGRATLEDIATKLAANM